ncbi:MAG: hypothetical protein ACYDAB_01900 [bacterium]
MSSSHAPRSEDHARRTDRVNECPPAHRGSNRDGPFWAAALAAAAALIVVRAAVAISLEQRLVVVWDPARCDF